jgi:hypothetical protein
MSEIKEITSHPNLDIRLKRSPSDFNSHFDFLFKSLDFGEIPRLNTLLSVVVSDNFSDDLKSVYNGYGGVKDGKQHSDSKTFGIMAFDTRNSPIKETVVINWNRIISCDDGDAAFRYVLHHELCHAHDLNKYMDIVTQSEVSKKTKDAIFPGSWVVWSEYYAVRKALRNVTPSLLYLIFMNTVFSLGAWGKSKGRIKEGTKNGSKLKPNYINKRVGYFVYCSATHLAILHGLGDLNAELKSYLLDSIEKILRDNKSSTNDFNVLLSDYTTVLRSFAVDSSVSRLGDILDSMFTHYNSLNSLTPFMSLYTSVSELRIKLGEVGVKALGS